jgi:hypothetical protein
MMRNLAVVAVICTAALAAAGCALPAEKNLVRLPINQKAQFVHVAIQQEVISKAINDFIKQISFKENLGGSAYVEICGVFPHTSEEVLEYIRASVEAKMAEDGWIIREKTEPLPDTNYRVVVAVAQCGADEEKNFTSTESYTYSYKGVCKLRIYLISRKEGMQSHILDYPETSCKKDHREHFYMFNESPEAAGGK